MNNTFIKPRYDRGGFASIPNRVKEAFASKKYDAVVLFFIDAFGWRFFEKFQDVPFIKQISKHGTVEKLTSQFPSTTAAHVTTIHTGLPVGVSGVHEWYYYEPSVDLVIAPLLFSKAGNFERESLRQLGGNASEVFPKGIFYPELKKMGVDSFNFGIRDYMASTYSKAVMKGSEVRGFKTLSEALINLGFLLEKQSKQTYIQLYFDKIDSLAHEYGAAAPQTEAEVQTFLLIMEHYFEKIFRGKKNVLFLMTADHGIAEVHPDRTVYLNKSRAFHGIEKFIISNRRKELIAPAGSARDMFLYIKDDLVDDAQDFLARRLEGKADVVKTESLIEQGYFGAEISKRFRDRVGNLVVLSYLNESVWWYEKDKFDMTFYGHHGGLTPQEMETILYSYEV
jgi:predicted AlkP superfamily pyrophosphatase or phosphodiesterase